MIIKYIIFSFSISLALATAAASDFSGRCVSDPRDPNDRGPLIEKGSHAGECLDTRHKRPITNFRETKDAYIFDNFFHDGHFWRAEVKRGSIAAAAFQIEHFPSPLPMVKAAHTQIRFKTKPGSAIRLTAQSGADGATIALTHGFVLSFEYSAPKGVAFDILLGLIDEFNIVGRVVSFETRTREQRKSGNSVDQYALRMRPDALDGLVLTALRYSEGDGDQNSYNTVSLNCTTEAFRVLDAGLTYVRPVEPFRIQMTAILDPVATPSLEALRKRRLIDDRSKTETAEEELTEIERGR